MAKGNRTKANATEEKTKRMQKTQDQICKDHKKRMNEYENVEPFGDLFYHIAILTEQIDTIVRLKPGLQTKQFKAIKKQLMQGLQ
jgi:hypothetical protein